MSTYRELILLGDIDEQVRVVDRLAERREWDEIDGLRRACRAAVERGHQLWPVSDWAAYRLVLHGPADLVTELLDDAPPRFPIGPLTEVAAQGLEWDEIGPALADRRVAATFAHERALRGEPLDHLLDVDGEVVEVPLRVAGWEPDYVLPSYSVNGIDPAEPPHITSVPIARPAPATVVGDVTTTTALEHLVAHRVANGEVEVGSVAVEGSAESAAGELVAGGRLRWSDLGADVALATWAWHAAGGRRRAGGAAGRTRVWWALAAALDLLDDWPLEPDELAASLDELRFGWFGPEGVDAAVGLAVEDTAHGLAWALRIDEIGDG